MATQENLNLAQTLYVAYYGRPADKSGLQFWAEKIEAEGAAAVVNDFGTSAEFDARFGNLSNEQLVNNLYNQLFGRNAELEGLEFYTSRLDNGDLSLAEIALEIAGGAQNDDAIALQNKVDVANAFTASIDTTEEVLAYQGNDAANAARDFLAQVDETTDPESVDVEAALAELVASDEQNPGDTFTLTAAADTVAGTEGDDTITALNVNAEGIAASTLTAFDEIDGAGGEDTLDIYTTAAHNTAFPSSASVQNVEIVNIHNEGAAADLADASNYEGVEQLWQIGSATSVTNLQASTTAGFRNTEQALAVTAAAGAASAAIALDGVAEGSEMEVLGESVNTVNVAGTLADTNEDGEVAALDLFVEAGVDEQTVTVNTEVDTLLSLSSDDSVTSVDALSSTGSIDFTGDADVSAIRTGTGDDVVALETAFSTTVTSASVTTGEGDDTITLNTTGDGDAMVDAGAGDDTITLNTGGDGDVMVDAGAGDDTITLNTGGDGDAMIDAGAGDDGVSVDAIEGVSTGSQIDGGEGTDTLTTNGGDLVAGDYTLLNNAFANFEELVLTAESDFDASRLADYTSFTLEQTSTVENVADEQALITEADLTATADGYDASGDETVYAGNLDITANATNTVTAEAASVALNANATEAGATTATLAGDVQEATVTVNNYVDQDDSAAFQEAQVEVENDAGQLESLESLTLSGDGSAVVTNGLGTDLVTVDASGLNTVNADGEATTGLDYLSTNDKAESISLGNGIDILYMAESASTVATTDAITGFNVAEDDVGDYVGDTLSFGADQDADESVTFEQLGEVEANSLDLALIDVASSITAGADDAAIFDFGGDSYLFQDSGTVGQVDDGDALLQLVGGVDQQMFAENATFTEVA